MAPALAAASVSATVAVGSGPWYVATAPTASKAYVTNYNANTVSVISSITNAVIATVPVGLNPACLAFGAGGTKVYVANWSDDSVSVISTSNDTVATTISVGTGPRCLIASPDGTRIYVVNSDSDSVSVISTASDTVAATVGVGNTPTSLAITPDGSKLYVANSVSSDVSVVSTASNTVLTAVSVFSSPQSIAVSSDGSKTFVGTGDASRELVAISTDSNTVTATVDLSGVATRLGVTGNTLYALSSSAGVPISVIDATSVSLMATISTPGKQRGISFVPDGSIAFVTSDNANMVYEIDTGTQTVISQIAVGAQPYYPAMSADGSVLFVPNFAGSSVSLVATGWVPASQGGDPSQYPVAAQQAFVLPADRSAEDCARSAPDHVNWPGLAGLTDQGWTRSWAQWPGEGRGGFVCSRQPYWTGSRWAVS